MINPQQPHNSPAPDNNTVRLKGPELAKLHAELEAGSRGASHARKCIRWDFLQLGVRVEMIQPGGAKSNLRYAARNISSEGMGILHNSYVHPGTGAVVWLPNREHKETPVDATVVRCRHVKGLIHEVGLRFKTALNVRDFMDVDPMEGRFTMEHVAPDRLSGSVLHVDDSQIDRRLVRHFLAGTTLNVVALETGKAALDRAAETFEIMLISQDLPDMTGTALAEQMRLRGVTAPIILLTADSGPAVKDAARGARVNAIVTKPVSQEGLLQAIGEFMLKDGATTSHGGPLYSTLEPADPAFGLVGEFVDELRQFGDKIGRAVAAEDLAVCRRLAFQVKGAAPTLGFAVIGEAAVAAMAAMDKSQSVLESGKALKALVTMCLRASARDGDTKKAA